MTDAKELFDRYANGKDQIGLQELRDLVRDIAVGDGLTPTPEYLQKTVYELLQKADGDLDGKISLKEWFVIYPNVKEAQNRQKLRHIQEFSNRVANGKEQIGVEELKDLVRDMFVGAGVKPKPDDIKDVVYHLMKSADNDLDGKISQEEWLLIYPKIKHLIEKAQ